MKKNAFLLLMISASVITSCSKAKLPNEEEPIINGQKLIIADAARLGGGGNGGPVVAFGLLGLEGGSFTVNSGTKVNATIGYCADVTSNTNQKVDHFTGKAYVHHDVASFIYMPATYDPSGGIIQNNGAADAALDRANDDALAASAQYAALPPNYTFGNLNANQTINSVTGNTVVNLSAVSYNSNTLKLVGRPGQDDGFIINVSGDFNFAQSRIELVNVRPERVIFNFPNASSVLVNKAATVFNGTILAPYGSVVYHNPATFNGAIIARNIAVHSAFNLTQKTFSYTPQ